MIRQLKKFTRQMVAGANVATIFVMVAVGYSDRLNPTDHPVLSCVGMTFPIFLLANLAFLLFWLTFRKRMIWIPIVGYALAYVPITIYMPLHMPTAQLPDSTLKVISYNVCEYGGNYKYEQGFEVIYEYLQKQDADIVCLQEDVDTWRRYVNQRYAKIYAYNDTVHFNNGPNINGVGIHTRFPILRRERIDYRSAANGSVAWFLNVRGDTVLVINNHFEGTHLSTEDRQLYQGMLKGNVPRDSARHESKRLLVTLAESAAKRAPQVQAVRRYIEAHQQYPIILCGDFNDNPISFSHHHIAEVLRDCYTETGWGIGLSYNQKGFYFRIDNIFCSADIQPYNCKVDGKIDASDHYPMMCWLKIARKQ